MVICEYPSAIVQGHRIRVEFTRRGLSTVVIDQGVTDEDTRIPITVSRAKEHLAYAMGTDR